MDGWYWVAHTQFYYCCFSICHWINWKYFFGTTRTPYRTDTNNTMTMCQFLIMIWVQFHRSGLHQGVNFADLNPRLWNWSPGARWSLSLWRDSKELVRMPALKCHILYTSRTSTFTLRQRAVWVRQSEGCELPLVEEKQRCNITWIFLWVFNQTKKDGTFSLRYYHRCLFWSDKTSVSVLVKIFKKEEEAIISVWPIGLWFYYFQWGGLFYYKLSRWQYWLPVWAQFTVFIFRKNLFIKTKKNS